MNHVAQATSQPLARRQPVGPPFHTDRHHRASSWFGGLTGLATLLIFLILVLLLGSICYHGWGGLSWRFLTSGTEGMFEVQTAGVLPMIVGTAARVILMTIFVMPVGVITAIYLTEYARPESVATRLIQGAIDNLAGVPSIVFGLFGLGFFIAFIGAGLDELMNHGVVQWGKPALIWASLTLAAMTLPVVIVATQESLRGLTPGLREGSLALGATKLETVWHLVLPEALPGILTGAILAVSRAAGEVAPLLFTGAAYFMSGWPRSINDQFMDLGYHVFVLSTQSPDIEKTSPLLFATVLVLLCLTLLLNLAAILVRARTRRQRRWGF